MLYTLQKPHFLCTSVLNVEPKPHEISSLISPLYLTLISGIHFITTFVITYIVVNLILMDIQLHALFTVLTKTNNKIS